MVCGFQNLNENKVLQLESTQKWLPRQIKHITIEQMINYPKLARLKIYIYIERERERNKH